MVFGGGLGFLADAGRLVVIGGAEDKENTCSILREVVKLAGAEKARILVLTAAACEPEQVGNEYRAVFTRLRVAEVGVLDISSRLQAADPMLLRLVDASSGILFTGGDQLRITSLIGGTPLGQSLQLAYRRGVVIAGTSAGASAMSSIMIVAGRDEEEPRSSNVRLAPGLGLLPDVVIDQHFAQRGRLGRLLSALAQNPYILGIGVDEDTAMIVAGHRFDVVGAGTVSILDGRHISFTNVSEVSPVEALALADLRLHVLPTGYSFDLQARIPGLSSCRNS